MSGNKECLVCSTPCKRTEIIDGNNRKYKLKTKFESITNIDVSSPRKFSFHNNFRQRTSLIMHLI